ncbi:MAG: transposase, partial [Chloroflexi bacterium]|nr:transposase [Chloroflexota bacterium]
RRSWRCSKILEVLRSVGIVIAAALSTLLIDQPIFAAEYEDIARAGLASSPYQHLDDTSTRVNGVEAHCHILCGPLFTLYHTIPRKDRQAVLDVLRLGAPRAYQLNRYAWAFLADHGLPGAVVTALGHLPQGVDLDADTFGALLEEHIPRLGPQQRAQILDAAAIGAYRVQQDVPVVEILVCDDAPQFKGVTADLALCWVHAGRHFKKLAPIFAQHWALVDTFLTDFWAYYHDLQAYRLQPTTAERARLDAAFDTLFARRTGYGHLDERIAKTAAKKEALLSVLAHPEVPLHNNPAELGARQRVRKRDVSFGPRSQAGVTAWDVFGTITQTAAKLGVNVAHYLHDRLSGANRMPALADLIIQRVAEAHAPVALAAA